MILIYTFYVLLSALVVFLIFYSPLNKAIKTIALTVLILLGLTTQEHYIDQLGRPIELHPDGSFVYVHHVVQGDNIFLWVWTENNGNRIHSIPYTQETAKELQDGKEKAENGVEQEGEFIDSHNGEAPGLVVDDWRGPRTEYNK